MPPAAKYSFPALELRQDGDIQVVKVKHSASKPTLKDLQGFFKKKTDPTLLTSYLYGERKLTLFGYTKGKETELNQHDLPPPFEASQIYGSILLIAHADAVSWDGEGIEAFSTADYEAFYEKACNGEIQTKDEADEDEADEDVVEEEEADEDAVAGEDGEEDEEEDLLESGDGDEEEGAEGEVVLDDDEEEEVTRPTRSRRAPKVDPQALQFQYANDLVQQQTPSEDAVDEYRTPVIQALELLLKGICKREDVLSLEMGIFNAALSEAETRKIPQSWQSEQFRWIYKIHAKRVASNFGPNADRLIQRWKDGEFTLDTLGSWSHYDLNPDNWKELKDQQFRREKRILEGNTAMATDRFRCSRCQKKMCTYYELQTRSADEPMTIFITCVNCGKQWRQ
jgi:hypothetical protein